ncbi:MAG: transporter [bacterium]|nr:transporter [bacterium]
MKVKKASKSRVYRHFKIIVALLLFTGGLFSVNAWGQTCSCAGAPVFNPLDYSAMDENKQWHFQLMYKYHAINDLVEGTQTVHDDTDRKRIAQSVFLEIQYSLGRNISAVALLNFTGHKREVGISSSSGVDTRGLGDSMLSIQYTPFRDVGGKSPELSIGGGVKAPTGRDKVELTGVAAEDMQPGTGSWDVIGWGFLTKRFQFIRGLELFAGASFRVNGTNGRDYRFGNELISSFGARLKTRGLLDYSLHARYRWSDSDKRFGGNVPNTGGNWLYLVPQLTVKAGKNFGFKTEVELPVYRKLNGFRQFTSTFLLSLSVFYEI